MQREIGRIANEKIGALPPRWAGILHAPWRANIAVFKLR
jgi:hypothetical protein